jgi:diacylglycerol kinase (CTP)
MHAQSCTTKLQVIPCTQIITIIQQNINQLTKQSNNPNNQPVKLKVNLMSQFDLVYQRATNEHGDQPTEAKMFAFIAILSVVGFSAATYVKTLSTKNADLLIQDFGVRLSKVKRTALEIERKTFHLTGLMVPLLYHVLLEHVGWSQGDFSSFCWTVTACAWLADLFRVYAPNGNDTFPFSLLKNVMREKERAQLSGTSFFSLGCTLAISLFPPAISTTSILWLVIGDMSAALIGVSFGGDMCVVKMGREGKKSLEGSMAMLIACTIIGMIIYGDIYMSEYAVFLGALVATVTELYEPFGLNDNLTIPIVSSLALQWGLSRIEMLQCQPSSF